MSMAKATSPPTANNSHGDFLAMHDYHAEQSAFNSVEHWMRFPSQPYSLPFSFCDDTAGAGFDISRLAGDLMSFCGLGAFWRRGSCNARNSWQN